METTAKLSLKKPGYDDPADIKDLNDNMDIIDSGVFTKAPLSGTEDANNIDLVGFFFAQGSACANLPTSDSTYYTVLAFGTVQFASKFSSDSNANTNLFMRTYRNNAWRSWHELARSKGNSASANLTLSSGWSGTTYEVQSTNNIGIIQLNGLTTGTTKTGWQTVATLPSGLWPKSRTLGVLACDNSMSSGKTSVAECRINTDGEVQIYAPQASEKYWGGFSYLIG